MKERSHLIANHLSKGYSDFVFSFLRNYVSKISRGTNILDVGCGRSRNLRLFHYFHFQNLMGIDRVASNDHDFHDFKLVEITPQNFCIACVRVYSQTSPFGFGLTVTPTTFLVP